MLRVARPQAIVSQSTRLSREALNRIRQTNDMQASKPLLLNRDRAINQTVEIGGSSSTRNYEKQFGTLKEALPAIVGAESLR